MSTTEKPSSVLFYELNEASEHFLTKYIAEGKLPALARMRREGAFLTTRIPTYRPDDPNKSWRDISPWIIWPSIYTGMTPEAHGIVGFGQDVSHLRGRFLWDVLDAHGHSVGVCGDLMSYPPPLRRQRPFLHSRSAGRCSRLLSRGSTPGARVLCVYGA